MGISYAVVTKVKELTETRQYGEALDLLEGEDIFQSLNPQFLRCCGEIYLENERYYESRKALVQAHVMAPEGNRIIYDLVYLYLKMGYFHRARHYYDIYIHNAGPEDSGGMFLEYMIQKSQRTEADKLLKILEQACEEHYTDEWAFELALLYASLGMNSQMKEACIRLSASFRNSPYCALAQALKNGQYDTDNSHFRFPIMEAEEDTELYASIIELETKQLEKDDLKLHPPAPVILQMEDDDGTEEEPAAKRKLLGIKLPFGKKNEKTADTAGTEVPVKEPSIQESSGNEPTSGETTWNVAEQEAIDAAEQKQDMSAASIREPKNEKQMDEEDNVSSYIASVMQSVADIEAEVEEDLQRDSSERKPYQSKLMDVEENLSPKERLEKLMKLIEEDREEETPKEPEVNQEEEMDLDEFLMNLVGANTITQAMVKSYHNENNSEDS